MATRYSRGSSRLSRIAAAPTYGASLSRYAAQLRSAITDMDKAEVDQAILSFKQGGMSYDDLKKYLTDKINSLPSGSLVQVDAQNALVDATKYQHDQDVQMARAKLQAQAADSGVTPQERATIETKLLQLETPGTAAYTQQQDKAIQAYENWQTQKVMDKRDELIQQYSKKGYLTTQDELNIVQELKKVADPQSKVYNQLVDQEQTLKQRAGTEAKAAGNTAATNDARTKLSDIVASQRDAELAYQQGQISGLTRDQAKLQNAQEAYQILVGLQKQGISVPEAQLTSAQEAYSDAQKMLQLRQTGQLFDVVDNNGKVIAVTPSGLTFQTNPNTGKTELVKANYENFSVKYDPTTQTYKVLNPDGSVLADNLPSPSAANALARQEGAYTINAVMTSSDGTQTTKELKRDPNTGAFYNPKNPSEVYSHIPQNAEDFNNAAIKGLSSNWLTDPAAQSFIKNNIQGFQEGLPNTGNSTFATNPTPNTGGNKGQASNTPGFGDALFNLFSGKPAYPGDVPFTPLKDAENLGKNVLDTTTKFVNNLGIDSGNILDTVKANIGPATSLLSGNIPGALFQSKPVQDTLSNIGANLSPVFNNLATSVTNLGSSLGSGISSGIGDISKSLSNAGSGISNLWNDINNFKLPDLPTLPDFKLPELPSFNFNLPSFSFGSSSNSNNNSGQPNFDLFGGISKLGSDIGSGLSSAANSIGSFLGGAFNSAKSFLGF